jgi:hypothetical protein
MLLSNAWKTLVSDVCGLYGFATLIALRLAFVMFANAGLVFAR